MVLISAMFPARAAAPAVKAPDTPAGRALNEFVDSFNAGGQVRQTWLETRTTVEDGPRAHVLRTDAQLRQKYGEMLVVRVISSSREFVAAVVRHRTSFTHGYVTIAVAPTSPHKAVNIQLRAARPEEIQGAGILARFTARWEGFFRGKRAGQQ